jgi:hypothetical protein
MEHPQPAFEFLLSLPGELPPADNIFEDWPAWTNAESGKTDDIRDHPEIWDTFELPNALAGLERNDTVAIQTFDGRLNINAIAIGLGLENIKYEPERFPSLVYEPDPANTVVFVWRSEVIVSIPKEAGNTSEAVSGVELLADRLHALGLTDDIQFDDAITTHRVSSVVS